MRRLNLVHSPERGAVAVIVVFLLSSGVLMGTAALTIDVGNLNAERRQVQNGADAASLAAANLCAKGSCPSMTTTELTNLANANAADKKTNIKRLDSQPAVCGDSGDPAHPLPPCTVTTPLVSDLTECPPATKPVGAKGWVRVYTTTELADGSTILPYIFAQTLSGAFKGGTQQTCASTAWGRPGPTANAVPIALSFCEWKAATGYVPEPTPPASTPPGNPGVFAPSPVPPAPGYTSVTGASQPHWPAPAQVPPVPGQEIVINLQGDSTTDTCANWQGADAPGGFGWLSQSGACVASAPNGGWINVSSGTADQCKTPGGTTDLSKFFEKVTYLPVYDCVYGSVSMPTFTPTKTTVCAPAPGTGPGGANTWYHIEGYASFYLSGWYFNGGDIQASPTTGLAPTCDKKTCISGWFTQGLVAEPVPIDDSSDGGPGLGAWTIQVLG